MREPLPPAAGAPLLELLVKSDPIRASPAFLVAMLEHPHVGVRAAAERHLAAHFLAECQFRMRRWHDCIDSCYRALRIDPRYAETHCLIADCYGELGMFDFAQQWYQSAIACVEPPPESILFVDRSRYDAYPQRGIEICQKRLKGG